MIQVKFKQEQDALKATAEGLLAKVSLDEGYVVKVEYFRQESSQAVDELKRQARLLQNFVNAHKGRVPDRAELLSAFLERGQEVVRAMRRRAAKNRRSKNP